MRKIILTIMLVIPFYGISQKKSENKSEKSKIELADKKSNTILIEDFKFPYNHPEKGNLGFYVDKKIKVKDGADNDVFVSVSSEPIKDDLLKNKLIFCCFDIYIKHLLSTTKDNLKNSFTFIPRTIHLKYLEKNDKWEVSVRYSAQNDFGALKDGYNSLIF